MNTRLLHTLLAVHQHGSMAGAARRLNLTHGAVAQQIRALENELGVSLVRRAGKVVHLTQAAHRILDTSQRILDDIDALAALANTNELRGELRLGSGNTALVGKIPNILEVLAAQYPEIHVSVVSGQSSDFHTQVERGALDAAIAMQPMFTPSKGLGWHLLWEEPFVLIASRQHEGVDPHLLLERVPFIRYHRDSWAGQQIDAYLRQNNLRPRERFELASTETITRLVHKNLGVAIVPTAWNQWQSGSIISMPLKTPCKPRCFGLIWLRSSPRLQLIEAFLKAAVMAHRAEETANA
ncbi:MULTISPECIES: LysR family transcriptional regulator [unclassified Bordetella]|uniref:LysR family transcriptional regulator n=1 Tax=unclassified Bordetella TaxID=2630031 RepID=UPI00132C1E9E|nr:MULTISPECIES: LysR family transcriptional regulator [unclassified Bordetella]MVW70352.1 LysR family transcriptional regulator [Bordetella sp. 15P40C-2]MVW78127.1 LysR family transcriptional regulator [Bordetella sp. 02P26C-1]